MSWRTIQVLILLVAAPVLVWGQTGSAPSASPASIQPGAGVGLAEERNLRLQELVRSVSDQPTSAPATRDYRIGPDDLLAITVLEAPDLSGSVRVSAGGEISLPLLGVIKAAGLTPRELELVLQELLRRTYMKDPHVGVLVSEMQSHPVSVLGAVNKPGVFQIRGTKTLLEMLSMAEGLAEGAGDTVFVMRHASPGVGPVSKVASREEETLNPASARETAGAAPTSLPTDPVEEGDTVEINVKDLLESGEARHNVPIYPGDIIKVTLAGIVYVVGEVNKPGGFPLKHNQKLTVLQALALGEGLAPTAAKGKASVIRTSDDGNRSEVPIDLGKILKGKAPDLPLQAKDILFVPNSTTKSAARASIDALVRVVTFRGVIPF